LDEESKESAQDRDERRWIDKQNKAARLKRKKEEVTRVRQLVDNAYACDPRIIKFKQEEKRRKEEEKQKRKDAQKQREEEERKRLEEARLEREKREEEERTRLEAEKREKEVQKKQIKKEKKQLRNTCKEFNYFADNEDERIKLMDEIERLIDLLKLNEIQLLNENIAKNQKELNEVKNLIMEMLDNMNKRFEEDKRTLEAKSKSEDGKSNVEQLNQQKAKEWSDEEIKLLVKGCKVIAVGTRDRWDVIANFIEEHSRGKYKRIGKEVLAKTKELQKIDPSVKEEFNKKAFEKTLQTIKTDASIQEKPSERFETPGEQLLAEQGSNPAPWTAQEQKLLEQAMKTYSSNVADRWDKIAECIPSRSKKDCMMRYKELVELIQAKKKAQAKSNS
jgi:DnaJ homolog subfamily C member 2